MEQKRKVLPPVYLLLALLAMAGLHFLFPIARVIEWPFTLLGVLVIAFGVILAAVAARLFSRAGTPVIPFERSTALVTSGTYRYTRNPMYLGMTLVLTGAWLLFGTLTPLIAILAFVWIIQRNFVRGEERFLETLFAEEYRAYKQQVRRWI